MSGEGGLERDRRGLPVPHLPHHDDVRILAEDGAEPGLEGEVRLGVHLPLGHPVEVVFDRVLQGDDVPLRALDLVEDRVERRGLPRAGRPHGEQHAAVPAHLRPQRHDHERGHPQGLEGAHGAVAVEHAQHALLPVLGGEGGHPEAQLHAVEQQLERAVLGHPPLGDVHLAEDLDPLHHREAELVQHARALLEHTVDAVAHPQVVLPWLEVEVARPLLDRPLQELVDQRDRALLFDGRASRDGAHGWRLLSGITGSGSTSGGRGSRTRCPPPRLAPSRSTPLRGSGA